MKLKEAISVLKTEKGACDLEISNNTSGIEGCGEEVKV